MGAQCCRQYNDKPYELTNLNNYPAPNILQKRTSVSSNSNNSKKEKCSQQDENFKEEASVTYINEPFRLEGDSEEIQEVRGDVDVVESVQQSQQFIQDCIPNNDSLDNLSDSQQCDDTNTKKTILKHDLKYLQNQNMKQKKDVIKKKVRFDLRQNK